MANFNLSEVDIHMTNAKKFFEWDRMKAEYLEAIEMQVYSDEPTISMVVNELVQLGYWQSYGLDTSYNLSDRYWSSESRFNFLYMILCAEGVV